MITDSPELQERAAYKRWSITGALRSALTVRLGSARRAGVLSDLGVRAYYDGFDAWVAADDGRSLTAVVLEELAAGEAAMRELLSEQEGEAHGS